MSFLPLKRFWEEPENRRKVYISVALSACGVIFVFAAMRILPPLLPRIRQNLATQSATPVSPPPTLKPIEVLKKAVDDYEGKYLEGLGKEDSRLEFPKLDFGITF